MITKYRAVNYKNRIEKVEVERETESSVWVNGMRNAKVSKWHIYFDYFDDAKDHQIAKVQREIDISSARLSKACAAKQDLLSMRESDIK